MEENCFDPSKWYCVLNLAKCPHSAEQLQILRDMKEEDAEVRKQPISVIDCGDPENSNVKICSSVRAFPAFCNTDQQKCVYGVREGRDELESTCKALIEGKVAPEQS